MFNLNNCRKYGDEYGYNSKCTYLNQRSRLRFPYIISHLDLARADTIMGGLRCEMLWLLYNFYRYYERIFIAQ